MKLISLLLILIFSLSSASAKDPYGSGFYVYNIDDSFKYTPGDYLDWQETEDDRLDHPHHMFQTFFKYSGDQMGQYTCFFGDKSQSSKFFIELFNDKVNVNGSYINTLKLIKGSNKNTLSFQLFNARDALDLGRKVTISFKRCSIIP